MTHNGSRPLVLIAILLACGCADERAGASAEQLRERDLAARQACIAERLSQRADDELRTLEEIGVFSGPVAFQQAYTQHARLRHAAFTQLDSALNHSRSPADSTAHREAARRFQIRAPEPESVEENVIRSYERNFAAILSDSNHPCNWQSELGSD